MQTLAVEADTAQIGNGGSDILCRRTGADADDCFDACGLIGSGFHERTVIHTGRFMAKVAEKARAISQPAAA